MISTCHNLATIIFDMDIENQQDKKTEERMRCLFAHMYIVNSKFHKLFHTHKPTRHLLDNSVGTLSHKRKKVNEKLVSMKFLKDNKNIVLGYDKTSERGDINFIDASQPKISDFYYNKLQGGLGGLSCFQDGRFILAADKKGVFAYVDLSKGPNIDDIKNNSIQTAYEGVLDMCLSPFQTKVICGMSDNKCLIIDIGKEKMKSVPTLNRKFSQHVYGVNSVSWHPFKSLILSSSLDINDSIKLWDPHSEQIIQQINLHHNATITRSLFHPMGNTFFSIGKDNSVYEYEIRFTGHLHKFKLDHQPTALEIMHNGNIVIGDSNGSLNWYDRLGSHIKRVEGSSAVAMMSADWSRTLLAVGRQRQHTFQFYTYEDAFDLELS